MADKQLSCKQCGRVFWGHHNAMFCADCREERARMASHRTWEKIKASRERKMMQTYGRHISDFDIEQIDMKFAKEMGKTVGSFQIWKFSHEEEYKKMLQDAGYQFVRGQIYKV